jgi:hypothetical protein
MTDGYEPEPMRDDDIEIVKAALAENATESFSFEPVLRIEAELERLRAKEKER